MNYNFLALFYVLSNFEPVLGIFFLVDDLYCKLICKTSPIIIAKAERIKVLFMH